MFLSGFVKDMAMCERYPPVQLVSWMLDQGTPEFLDADNRTG